MRKHSKQMATRWGRNPGDRSNFASSFSHKLANDKGFQLGANGLVCRMLRRVGVNV